MPNLTDFSQYPVDPNIPTFPASAYYETEMRGDVKQKFSCHALGEHWMSAGVETSHDNSAACEPAMTDAAPCGDEGTQDERAVREQARGALVSWAYLYFADDPVATDLDANWGVY